MYKLYKMLLKPIQYTPTPGGEIPVVERAHGFFCFVCQGSFLSAQLLISKLNGYNLKYLVAFARHRSCFSCSHK